MTDDDLKSRSKRELIREVRSLRAILEEHRGTDRRATDPAGAGGGITDVLGDPHARHGVVLDTNRAVLMDSVEVSLVEPYRDGEAGGAVLAMALAGRVNRSTERARVLYLFDTDGAAAVISELTALAQRIGPDFARLLAARLEAAPK